MNNENETNGKNKWLPNSSVNFSERNLNRWAIYGSRNARIERILKRENDNGAVVETCHIGAVGYKGRMQSLSSVHGRLMNIVEMLFYRQGMPADNIIRISSIALYNYLADIATMFNAEKMKDRDGNKFRDWIYDILHVLVQLTLVFSAWEKKDGSRGVYGLNLIKGFRMWGKQGIGKIGNSLFSEAEWGMISIALDPEYANGLRERNTTPFLIEVENSIKGDNAFALYRYLRQILFKTPIFKCRVVDLHNRLSIGSKRRDHLISDFREAAKELEGKEIPNGRIGKCEVIQENREWCLVATLALAERRVAIRDPHADRRRAEEQRLKDSVIREAEYVTAFENLAGEEKTRCEREVEEILSQRCKNGLGAATHRKIAICEVMHNYFMRKGGAAAAGYCDPGLMACEDGRVKYIGKYQRVALIALRDALSRYYATKQPSAILL